MLETNDTIMFWVEAYKDHTLLLFIILGIIATLIENLLKRTIFADFDDLIYNTFIAIIGLVLIILGMIIPKDSQFARLSMNISRSWLPRTF